MPTLILSPRYTTDSIALAKAAAGLGWSVQRLLNWHAPDGLSSDAFALYGEPFFAAAIAEQLSLHLLEPPFDWLATLPVSYSKRRVFCTTLGEARLVAASAFIKPADDKCFSAQVYLSGAELRDTDHLPAETPVLVSEPVEWEVEYRGFIRHNELQTLSPYFRDGNLAQTEDGDWPAAEEEVQEARDFYTGFLSDSEVKLPPGVVVDIGRIRGRGWAVVEANPAWSSGIYGCDPSQVLPVVESACVRMDAVPDAHSQWIISRTD
jgi:hypothetical protein